MKKITAALSCLTLFASVYAQPIGSWTITVTESVSGNEHTEETAIIEEDGFYAFHRAIGDTVTIEDGFKVGDLYCFREFKANGSLTICKVDEDNLYGYSLTPEGFFFSFTSDVENPMNIDHTDYSGIYTAKGGEGPAKDYESIYMIYPVDGDWLIEQDFDGDENAEISGFGFAVERVLTVALEPADVTDSWTLACYEFEGEGYNAKGWWLTKAVINSEGYVEESSGWEDLEFIQGFDH